MRARRGGQVRDMACGAEHSIALMGNGEVYSWGWGAYGNLGDGETVDRYVPVKVRMSAGMHACKHARCA